MASQKHSVLYVVKSCHMTLFFPLIFNVAWWSSKCFLFFFFFFSFKKKLASSHGLDRTCTHPVLILPVRFSEKGWPDSRQHQMCVSVEINFPVGPQELLLGCLLPVYFSKGVKRKMRIVTCEWSEKWTARCPLTYCYVHTTSLFQSCPCNYFSWRDKLRGCMEVTWGPEGDRKQEGYYNIISDHQSVKHGLRWRISSYKKSHFDLYSSPLSHHCKCLSIFHVGMELNTFTVQIWGLHTFLTYMIPLYNTLHLYSTTIQREIYILFTFTTLIRPLGLYLGVVWFCHFLILFCPFLTNHVLLFISSLWLISHRFHSSPVFCYFLTPLVSLSPCFPPSLFISLASSKWSYSEAFWRPGNVRKEMNIYILLFWCIVVIGRTPPSDTVRCKQLNTLHDYQLQTLMKAKRSDWKLQKDLC